MASGRSAQHRARGKRARDRAPGPAGPSGPEPGRTGPSGAEPRRRGGRRQLPDKNTLAGRASRALGWSFTSNAVAKFGTVGIGIMLARLLGPHAFGTYAVAYVALIALLSFNELGVSLAIVRWPGEPAEIAPTVTTLSVATSIIIYAGCFLGAPRYAAAMGAPAAATVIRVLALNVIIDGVVSTPAALLQRQLRQGKIMVSDQLNCWLGAGVTIWLAWAGFGAMSLAIGRMAGCLAGAVPLIIYSPERLRLGFSRVKARALLRFGLPLAGSSLVVFAVANVDQLVVGRVLGATALGYYALASNLSGWPSTMFSQPVRSVAPAVFSRLQHDRRAMVGGFLAVAGLLCAVALPVCAMLSGSSVATIGFIYGARWLPAAQALIWLGVLAGLRIFFELVYDYFVVLAKSRVVLITQLVWLGALIPALIVGARARGIFGAGLAGVAVAAAVVLPWYLVELRYVGIRLRALAARLARPLAGAALAGLAAYAIRRAITTDLIALLASGTATLLVIALLIYQMRPALRLLRPGASQPATSPAHAAAESADVRRKTADAIELLIAIARVQQPALQPTRMDMTGPIPIYQDMMIPVSRHTSPLYLKTIASQRWNPTMDQHAPSGPAPRIPAPLPTRPGRAPARALPEAADTDQISIAADHHAANRRARNHRATDQGDLRDDPYEAIYRP
jgi:O-antigen/teichoic acid export membrane protein